MALAPEGILFRQKGVLSMLYNRIQIFVIGVAAISASILVVQYLHSFPIIATKTVVYLIAFLFIFALSVGLLAHYLPRWKYFEITVSIGQFLFFVGYGIFYLRDSSIRQYWQHSKIWLDILSILWIGMIIWNAYVLVNAIAKRKLPDESRDSHNLVVKEG